MLLKTSLKDCVIFGAMQLTFARPQRVMEVGVERYAGCYFVRF